MLTKERIVAAATKIGCKPAAIVAVDSVESGGNGFIATGVVKILFEPHIFWKQLRDIGIDPNKYASNPRYKDILYSVWGTKPYGKISEQHERLTRASEINKEAAEKSASWGRYQTLAMNWRECKCLSLQDFLDKVSKSEDDQLDCFINYIMYRKLDDELINLDWAGFARSYNGPLYTKNNYDKKLSTAYLQALSFNK